MNDIKVLEQNLSKTTNEKNASMQQLQSISKKVEMRLALINNINLQVVELNKDIQEKNTAISLMSADLYKLKNQYANTLNFLYKNMVDDNIITYVINAESIKDAYNRYLLFKKYTEYNEVQSLKIMNSIQSLNDKIEALNIAKAEKTKMMANEKEQKAKIEIEKKQKDALVKKLVLDEAKIKTAVIKKNKEAKELNAQIQKIIDKEIADAKKRAAAKAKTTAKTSTTTSPTKSTNSTSGSTTKTVTKENDVALNLTPAELTLSNDFEYNKGKLPWPVEKGNITSTFGRHPHAFLSEVIVENNGIDIKTTPGANVRSIFEGTVISVFYMSFNQNSVIIKHGEYFSVYSNLKTVNVKINTKVTTKQVIGTAYTNPTDNVSSMHLELWKGHLKNDPAIWIRAQ
ncbi:MAG: peptidoglycan DD-metalloendopeptidase family protein [Bacteroidota bacterium]